MNYSERMSRLLTKEVKEASNKEELKSLIGSIWYQRLDKDPRYFRTIRIGQSQMHNRLIPQATDFIMGNPPTGIPEISSALLNRLMRM